MNKEQLATELRQEAERLVKAAELLAPTLAPNPTIPTPIKAAKRRIGARRLSAAQRAKLAAGQQRRRARERAAAGQPMPQAA